MLFAQHTNLNMMKLAQFGLCLICLFVGEMAQMTNLTLTVLQERGFVSAHGGDSLILQCFCNKDVVARYYWYKQTPWQNLRLISTFYKYNTNGTFHDEFMNDPRFSLDTEAGKNHLTIRDVRRSDAATYYCVNGFSTTFRFMEGITVSVEGSGLNIQARVHQSASETVQPGGSVTLSCTVQNGTCDGEHSVYWFKNFEESHPELIYTHGDRDDQCERKPNTQTHSCVYQNAAVKSLNLSHAGTDYCAVTSCGHVLFGNGTKLDIEGESLGFLRVKTNVCYPLIKVLKMLSSVTSPVVKLFPDEAYTLVTLYLLSAAVTCNTILSALLGVCVCAVNKRRSCICTESPARFSDPSRNNAKGLKTEDNLYYNVPVSEKKLNGPRRRWDNTWTECVYLSVKQ
uniref:Ig-like domain-containing protein n=1 Tax=Scophthalmus maximus TaxID=52904 RepID=A0A8D3DFZ4_SCOMX